MRHLTALLLLLVVSCTAPTEARKFGAYTPIPGGTAGGQLGASYYQGRALQFLGISSSNKNFGFFWDDFTANAATTSSTGWQASPVGTGALSTRVASTKGGMQQITTGATAASFMEIWTNEVLVSDLSAEKWYVVFRQKVTTAVTAQTKAWSGLFNVAGNKSVAAGVFGASSVVNFVWQYDGNATGSFLDSGVAIDTAYHVFEAYSKGEGNNKVYVRSDEGAEASVTAAAHPTDGVFILSQITNGTDAVTRTMQRDFTGALFPR